MSFPITLTFCQQFVPDKKSEALEQSSLGKLENVIFGIIHCYCLINIFKEYFLILWKFLILRIHILKSLFSFRLYLLKGQKSHLL